MFDIKKYFPDDPEIMNFLQKQFHCKWMYTYTYAAIPQSLNGSALKEFVYKVSSKPLNVCGGGGGGCRQSDRDKQK